MKRLRKIGIGILVVLITILALRDALILSAATMVGSHIIGAPLRIESFSSSVFTRTVRMKGVTLGNPRGFPHETMLSVPEVTVSCDLLALLRGKLHVPLLVLNIHEVVIVRNKEGALNVEELPVIKQSGQSKEPSEDGAEQAAKSKPKPKSPPKMLPMQLDVVKLNLDRVVFKDFSKGDEPAIRVYETPLRNKTLKDITSVQQLAVLVMAHALAPTAIKSVGIRAATTLMGVGFIPAAVASVVLGKDDAKAEFRQGFNEVYRACLQVMKEIGTVKTESREQRMIVGHVDKCRIVLQLESTPQRTVRVTAIGRKMMLPQPAVAGGVLYRISERLE